MCATGTLVNISDWLWVQKGQERALMCSLYFQGVRDLGPVAGELLRKLEQPSRRDTEEEECILGRAALLQMISTIGTTTRRGLGGILSCF